MPQKHLLAFDIGATKTNAALFSNHYSGPLAIRKNFYSWSWLNADMEEPEEIIAEGLKNAAISVDIIVLAIAGPVTEDGAQLTNRSWNFNKERLQNHFGINEIFIINDLEAFALGVPHLKPDQICQIQGKLPDKKGTIAVIAPGTGLGESFMTWSTDRYVAYPSEGGHSDFAPIDDLQIKLLKFLRKQYEHVSYERTCSGLGLINIYNFLKSQVDMKEPAWLAEEFARGQDHARTIVMAAVNKTRPCDICRRSVSIFTAVLGSEAGNLALRTLPKGGVYIGGGIAPRIVTYLTSKEFIAAFVNKGRMKSYLETIPVTIILDSRLPLHGAAYYGFNQ